MKFKCAMCYKIYPALGSKLTYLASLGRRSRVCAECYKRKNNKGVDKK